MKPHRPMLQRLMVATVLMLSGIGTANALLIDKGSYVLDDRSGLLWSRDDVQIDYTYAEATDRIDALNLSNTSMDINNDGYLDRLAWSIPKYDTVLDVYRSYTLADRDTAFDTGSRRITNLNDVRIKTYWTNLVMAWAIVGQTPRPLGLGWGNRLGPCGIGPFSCFMVEPERDVFYGFYLEPREAGLWATAKVTYGVPAPATWFLIASALFGLRCWRFVETRSK